jgi:SLA1 homology domain 1, SHD1
MTSHSTHRSFASTLLALTGLVALLLVVGVNAWAEELRTWTDSTGKHKMEGKYAGMAGTKVKLELKTGKKMEIDLKKLSEADQKYVESLDADNPFKAESDDPFKPEGEGGEEMATGQARTVTVNWSAAED